MYTIMVIDDDESIGNMEQELLERERYDKMFCVLMENEICRKVCEKNKYNSWMNLIGQYCVSRT